MYIYLRVLHPFPTTITNGLIKCIMLLTHENYFHLHVDASSLDVVTTIVDNHTVKHNCATVSHLEIFRQLHTEETYGIQALIESKRHMISEFSKISNA